MLFAAQSEGRSYIHLAKTFGNILVRIKVFFLIDNKSFIDEKNNVFTIVNSLPLNTIVRIKVK